MKKKAQAGGKGNDEQAGDKQQKRQPAPVKSFDKKEPVDFKSRMLADRRAQKAKKIENKKIAKVEEQQKQTTTLPPSSDDKPKIKNMSEFEPEKKVHFKKSMLKKTRSKQKNKKKDNRPEDLKRQKLAEKYITSS